jgi:predicted phosphodiesterase
VKILIFSDTHFGPKADHRLPKLKKLISEADRVIINGDFFERYLLSFEDFLNSDWKELFSLLKEKDAAYIYGNHDKEEFSDKRVEVFSNYQGDHIEIQSGDKKFYITHGHLFTPAIEERFKAILYVKPLTWFVFYFGNILYRTGIYYLLPFAKGQNKKIYREWIKTGNKATLVCGHSHLATISEDKKYYNGGLIRWHYFSYIVIEDGVISIHQD